MSQKVKCPRCGKLNDLVNFNDFRYPFASIPKEAQDEIKRLTEQNINPGIMLCFSCQAFGVFPLQGKK
jgi:hypothetical protein